jgi:eukaryotic-like serine/threonine-protein kinase
MIGQTISHYKILEKLGEGGMGVVYKAHDTKLDRFVALKFLPPELTRELEAKERFIHEAQAASALQHDHVCTIHDIDEAGDGRMFICMDFYGDETLKKKVERGPLPLHEAIALAIQIALGLEAAHEAGIIHRDIKPANIMITSKGEVKIVDFGIAKLSGQTLLTKSLSTMGTAAYMSPEQARGEELDPRTDVWSLGVVLYEMIAAKTPFRGEHEVAMVYSIVNEELPPVSNVRSDVPPELASIIAKMLQKDRTVRCSSMTDVVQELSRLQSTETTTMNPRLILKQIKRPAWAIPLTIIILGLGSLLYYWIDRNNKI